MIFPKSGNVHGLVRKSLKNAHPRLARDLDDLRRLRNRADYDLHYSKAQFDAEDLVERAQILIATLKND
jgi:predicted RNA-binding protein (virulence factor B family)